MEEVYLGEPKKGINPPGFTLKMRKPKFYQNA